MITAKHSFLLMLSFMIGSAGLFAPVNTSAQQAEPRTGRASVMEEIVVTARKRTENLQDIPLAVTAFSAAEIESAGLRDVEDVASLTPGFNVAPLFAGDATTPVIRGLSTTIGEPNVGFFVDGVYAGSRQTMTSLLGNFISRIEIARGPQSALYGRNTFGGAVNYVTRQPSEAFEGELEATYGSHGKQVARATLGGPFGDTGFSYRLAAMSDEFDGFYTNELTGEDLDVRDTKGALATLAYRGDTLDVDWNTMFTQVDDGDSPLRFEENNDSFFSFAGLPPTFQIFTGEVPAHEEGFAVTPGGLDRDQFFTSLKLEWDYGPAAFTSVTGYNDFSHDRLTDDDYQADDFHFLTTLTDVTEISQEFRLTSADGGNIRWMIGAYGYGLDDDTAVESAYQGFLLPIFGGINSVTSQETDSLAVFGSVDWDISDAVTLGLEARYGWEEKSVRAVDTDLATGASAVFENEEDWNSFLPRVSLDWRFTENHMVYASYAFSEKAGGFNVVTLTGNVLPDERTYQPEQSDNFEVGLKSTYADGNVLTTLSAYYIKWEDQIVRAIGQAGALLNSNAGETTSQGFEFEVLAQLSDYWDFRGGLSYNNSEYDEYFFAILAAVGLDPVLDGVTLQYAPEWTANASLGFTVPVGNGWEWFSRVDASYTDEQNIVQTGSAFVDATNRVNIRTGLNVGNWVISAWAYNLFEPDDALTGVFTGDPARLPELFIFGTREGFPAFSPLVTSPDRRSYGLTVKYRF